MAEMVCAVVMFAAAYILILWFSISIAITSNGPIRWEAGWDQTLGHLSTYEIRIQSPELPEATEVQ